MTGFGDDLAAQAKSQYPMVDWLIRHGDRFAAGIAIAILAGGLWALVAWGAWLMMAGSVVLAGAAFVLLKSYAELVRIIADMLLPK